MAHRYGFVEIVTLPQQKPQKRLEMVLFLERAWRIFTNQNCLSCSGRQADNPAFRLSSRLASSTAVRWTYSRLVGYPPMMGGRYSEERRWRMG